MNNRNFILVSAISGLTLGLVVFLIDSALSGRSPDATMRQLISGQRTHSYHTGISRASPAVVSIYSSETIYRSGNGNDGTSLENSIAPPERRSTNQGSGVIISHDGLVLTNNHLVRDPDEINVALADGRLFTAHKVGADPETDLAVIRIDTDVSLPSCSLSHQSDVRVGDIVLAIGNPFGVGQTVTQGIVSAIGRYVSGASRLQHFIQIDAAINPGNSGGALINPEGDLVGINTAIFSPQNGAQGIGFAIPADLIRQVVPQIIERGRVVRGWLGIGAENLHRFPDLYRLVNHGAVISGVFVQSPAHISGLRRGDIVTHVNGAAIHSSDQLLQMISTLSPGSTVRIQGQRLRQEFDLTLQLAERPVT